MAFRRNPEPGRQAVLWLATAFVTVIGAAACAFIILAAVDQPSSQFLVLACFLGGLAVMLVVLARSGETGTGNPLLLWLRLRKPADPKTVLKIGKKRRAAEEYGTQQPPTLETVRDAAELNVTWVPHGPTPPRRSQP